MATVMAAICAVDDWAEGDAGKEEMKNMELADKRVLP